MRSANQGRHAPKATPRTGRGPSRRMPGRRGVILAALAVVMAAVVALPALVALAAPEYVSVEVTPKSNHVEGSWEDMQVYGGDATFTVSVTVESGAKFVSNGSTVSASGGATLTQGDWSGPATGSEGAETYSKDVTLTSGTRASLLVTVAYTVGEGADAQTASFAYGDPSAFTPTPVQVGDSLPVTIDKDSPEVSIQMSQPTIGNSDDGSGRVVDYFGQEGLRATIRVTDPTFVSGGTTVVDADDRVMALSEWTREGDTWTASIDASGTDSFTVRAKDGVADHAAAEVSYGTNTTDSDGTSLTGSSYQVDTHKIAVEMTFDGSASDEFFTSADGGIEVRVTVRGDNLGDVEIFLNGSQESGWNESEGAGGSKVFEKTISGEGVYDLSVSAYKSYDIAHSLSGLSGTLQKTLTIDDTSPTIMVNFSDGAQPVVENGETYYPAQRTAQVVVTEASSFSPDKMSVKVNGAEVGDLKWANGEDGTHTAAITFGATSGTYPDGTYRLEVSGEDLAGNTAVVAGGSSTTYTSDEFTVDTTNPKLSITCDNDNVQNAKYYQAARTFTIVASDERIDPDAFVVTVDGTVDSGVKWTQQSDGTYQTTVSFDTAGGHSLKVEARDYAGNTITSGADDFVIDLTDPVISVVWDSQGSEGKDHNFDGGRTATVTVKDDNVDLKNGFTIEASGAEVSEWDEATKSATVTFADDGVYRLRVSGSDLSGRAAVTQDSGEFTIDTTAPVLSVSFADQDQAAGRDGDTSYYAAERTATITVDERNFDESLVEITGEGKQGEWQNPEGDTHTLEVTFPESADPYEMTVHATDKAGNDSARSADSTESYTYGSGTFVVDTTPAEVSVQLNQQRVQTVGGVDYFAAAPTATVTVRDVNFRPGASSVAVTGGTAATVGDWTQGDTDGSGVTTWTAPVTFTEGTGRTLSVTAADWAAHTTPNAYGVNTTDSQGTQLVSSTLTVDLTAPEVTSASVDRDPVNSYGDNYYFNAATTLTVSVADNIGMESLTMTDADEGYYVLDNQVEAGAATGTVTIGFADGHDFDRAVTVRTTDLAHNYRYWSIAPDGTVQAVNYADPSNEPVFDGTYPESMLQDTVAPVVSLSGVEAGAYYAAPQSVLLSVDELNMPILRTYEPDQTVFTVTRVAGDASGATTTWTRPLSQLGSVSGINYQLSEPLAADGHYTISAQVTDPARNQGSAQIGEFTIDQTAPTVEVSFDNNDVLNGRYYKVGRTATITVVEHNFDPSLVSIDTNGAVGSWSSSGDTHTIQVSFSTDGVYNLSVSGSDRAGNEMTPYQADEFVVDLTAPTVTISGVEDSTAYKGVVEPTISFADEANFDAEGTSYTLTGTKNGAVSFDAATSDAGQGRTVSFADFAREADVDDIYTLSAHMTDLAGNEAEATVTFSVNRFGSTFRVVDAGSYTANDGYLTESRDVVIEEVNVSGVASERHAVTVTEGTTVTDLALNDEAQETGYTIDSGTSSDDESRGWSLYTYRVAAGNFATDGRYHVSVESNDRADNTNTSSSYYDRSTGEVAAAEVDFILDTTDPVITNLNIADGQTYESDAYQGSFTVVENIGVRDVEVLVDGVPVQATDDGYGNYAFEVSSASFTPRDLQVTVTDLSGRTGSAGAEGFHVTTDVFELHLPWVIAGAIVVAAAAGTTGYVIVRKRRETDSESSE